MNNTGLKAILITINLSNCLIQLKISQCLTLYVSVLLNIPFKIEKNNDPFLLHVVD